MSEELIARMKRIEERQDKLEQRHDEMTAFIVSELDNMGSYRHRTDKELSEMTGKVELLSQVISVHQNVFEKQEDRDRAKAVNRRLKNNQTRLNKEKNNRESNM
jgi:hypothetical protein